MAAGATRPTKTTPPPLSLPPSSSMSFSDAKAKVAAATVKAEKVRDSGGQWAQAIASQPHKTRHDNEKGSDAHAAAERRAEDEDEEVEEVELCMPGLFDFEDHNSGAVRAGTVDPFDAVSMPALRNLW